MKLKNKIIDILKQCYDPEIPIDLWNLGLIYDIDIQQNDNGISDVKVIMSLTTPGCTMGQHMAEDIKAKVSAICCPIVHPGVVKDMITFTSDMPLSFC